MLLFDRAWVFQRLALYLMVCGITSQRGSSGYCPTVAGPLSAHRRQLVAFGQLWEAAVPSEKRDEGWRDPLADTAAAACIHVFYEGTPYCTLK